MNKIIFLSHFLDELTPGYGGVKSFEAKHVSEISQGATSNSQQWILSNHVGTHIDLPSHFDDLGKRLDQFEASDWIFTSPYLLSIEVRENQIITPGAEFDFIPQQCDILLIKTNFQQHRNTSLYWSNGPGLSPDLAKWLRKNRPALKVVGFDFISITSFPNRPLGRIAHKEFLGTEGENQPLRVIEDMKLDLLEAQPKKITVSPMLVRNADGAPVTVIAEL
ncbi:MAG: cyclase family protein [Bacteriovorax sp.]|nr:cyclase family protein [Bacteriovorax sp.]